DDRGPGRAPARGAVPPVRFVRRRLLQRVGPGERPAPPDHPRLRVQRPAPRAGPRGAAPALLARQAGLQDDQVPRAHDLHPGAARRLLGGSGLSLVRRALSVPWFAPSSPAPGSPSPTASSPTTTSPG